MIHMPKFSPFHICLSIYLLVSSSRNLFRKLKSSLVRSLARTTDQRRRGPRGPTAHSARGAVRCIAVCTIREAGEGQVVVVFAVVGFEKTTDRGRWCVVIIAWRGVWGPAAHAGLFHSPKPMHSLPSESERRRTRGEGSGNERWRLRIGIGRAVPRNGEQPCGASPATKNRPADSSTRSS